MIFAIDDVALPRSDWTFRRSPFVPRSNAAAMSLAAVPARLDDGDSDGRDMVIEGRLEAPLKADQTLPEASSGMLSRYIAMQRGGKPHTVTIGGRTFAAVRLWHVALVARAKVIDSPTDPGGCVVSQRVRFTWRPV